MIWISNLILKARVLITRALIMNIEFCMIFDELDLCYNMCGSNMVIDIYLNLKKAGELAICLLFLFKCVIILL